eukprot:6199530-Pleurochrysis_carterae.AAC.1
MVKKFSAELQSRVQEILKDVNRECGGDALSVQIAGYQGKNSWAAWSRTVQCAPDSTHLSVELWKSLTPSRLLATRAHPASCGPASFLRARQALVEAVQEGVESDTKLMVRSCTADATEHLAFGVQQQ